MGRRPAGGQANAEPEAGRENDTCKRQQKQCKRNGAMAATGAARGRQITKQAVGKRQTVPALSDQTRWRRRTVEGCATEYVDFWESAELGWVTRFHIRTEGAVAGRGLFAARDYAKGEHVAVYMGVDMGKSGTPESRAAQERLAAVKRADHVMEIAGRLVDGRHGISGAQYINTAKGVTGRADNAHFAKPTGSVRATAAKGIAAGTEIFIWK